MKIHNSKQDLMLNVVEMLSTDDELFVFLFLSPIRFSQVPTLELEKFLEEVK